MPIVPEQPSSLQIEKVKQLCQKVSFVKVVNIHFKEADDQYWNQKYDGRERLQMGEYRSSVCSNVLWSWYKFVQQALVTVVHVKYIEFVV